MICRLCKKDCSEFKTIELKKSEIYVCLKCVIEIGSALIRQAYEKYEKNSFEFNDIMQLDAHSMAVIIRCVGIKELAIALKNGSQEIIEHFKNHMSSNVAQILLDEISYLGRLRVKDVECIKSKIVETIIELEKRGEIIIRSDCRM